MIYLIPAGETLEWPNLYRFIANNAISRSDSWGLTLKDCLNKAKKNHDNQIASCRKNALAAGSICAGAALLGIGTGPTIPIIATGGGIAMTIAEHKCEDRANKRWADAINDCYAQNGKQENGLNSGK